MVHFDPATGKYTWAAQAIMQVTGILTVVILGDGHRPDGVSRSASRRRKTANLPQRHDDVENPHGRP